MRQIGCRSQRKCTSANMSPFCFHLRQGTRSKLKPLEPIYFQPKGAPTGCTNDFYHVIIFKFEGGQAQVRERIDFASSWVISAMSREYRFSPMGRTWATGGTEGADRSDGSERESSRAPKVLDPSKRCTKSEIGRTKDGVQYNGKPGFWKESYSSVRFRARTLFLVGSSHIFSNPCFSSPL